MLKELNDGTSYIKATYWKGEDLEGIWLATYKIDGIRCIRGKDNKIYSRDSKEMLHHLEKFNFNDAEFFFKNWNTSLSILSTEEETIPITQDMFYHLDNMHPDPRITIGKLVNPTKATIKALLKKALELGHEGIVLRSVNQLKPTWIKVVPVRYADVRIITIKEGTGKYKGMAGSIITKYGNVGSFNLQEGYTDPEFRQFLWNNRESFKNKIIQVAYREKTCTGKLKFPRLARIRYDKNEEDLGL